MCSAIELHFLTTITNQKKYPKHVNFEHETWSLIAHWRLETIKAPHHLSEKMVLSLLLISTKRYKTLNSYAMKHS